MNQNTYNEIQSLFQSGEVKSISFNELGNITVKYKKEPYVIRYKKSNNPVQTILEDIEVYKSLEAVEMKPKLKLTVDEFVKIHTLAADLKKPSLFERFYDSVSNFIGGGKSFAPNELKSFV